MGDGGKIKDKVLSDSVLRAEGESLRKGRLLWGEVLSAFLETESLAAVAENCKDASKVVLIGAARH